eukprot:UN10155
MWQLARVYHEILTCLQKFRSKRMKKSRWFENQGSSREMCKFRKKNVSVFKRKLMICGRVEISHFCDFF